MRARHGTTHWVGWPASEPVAIGALAEGHPAPRANRASGPGECGVKNGRRRHPAGAARRQNGLFDARVAACEPICECISGPISRSLAHMWDVAVALATSVLSVHTGGSEVARLLEGQESREDLARRLEEEFDRELLDEAVRRVRRRVAPRTWEAYQLTAVEGLAGLQVAERLGMKLTAVFMAKSNVLKLLRDEVNALDS